MTPLMRFTENGYLYDDINEQDVFLHEGNKNESTTFTSGAEYRLSTYKEFRWETF